MLAFLTILLGVCCYAIIASDDENTKWYSCYIAIALIISLILCG